MKKVNRKEQLCLVVHHEEFKTGDKYDELHAVVKHWKVHTEGDPDLFFTERREPEGQQQEHEQTPLPAAIDDLLSNQATTEQTIEALRGVVDIDDDNDPAPENVQQPLLHLSLAIGGMMVYVFASNKGIKITVHP